MAMHPKERELRILQEKIYSRDGKSVAGDVERLSKLQNRVQEPVQADEVLNRDATADGSHEEQTEPSNTPRKIRLSAAILLSSVMLVLGLMGGAGSTILNAKADGGHASEFPPDVTNYDSESVTYFGEIENAQVWVATKDGGQERCIIVQSEAWGGDNCSPASAIELTASLSGITNGTARQYTVRYNSDGKPGIVYETVDAEALLESE